MPPKNVRYTAKQSSGFYKAATDRRASFAVQKGNAARSKAFAATRSAPYVSRRRARVVKDSLKEKKYFDTATGGSTFGSDTSAANLVTDLAIIPQGDTVTSRQGKKLQCMRLAMKGTVYTSPIAGQTIGTLARLSIVWDREPDKAALVPTTTDVYMSNSSSALTNRDNAPRFKILKELMFPMAAWNTQAGGCDGATHYVVNEFLDLSRKGLDIIWTKADTTGATAAKVKGNLLAVWTFDQTVAAGGVGVQVNCRLDFSDASS